MNAPGLSLPSASTAAETAFVPAVLHGITWRKLLVAETLGLALAAVNSLTAGASGRYRLEIETELIIRSVEALVILVGAVAADEAIRRGTRMRVAYPLTLAVASVCAGILQWELRRWLGVLDLSPSFGTPFARIVSVVADVAVSGGLGMFAYLQRQTANRLVEGIRTRELRRVQAERQLLEANLAMTQSQIDPAALSRELALIRDDYAAALPSADTRLDELIQYLRSRVARGLVFTRSLQPPP